MISLIFGSDRHTGILSRTKTSDINMYVRLPTVQTPKHMLQLQKACSSNIIAQGVVKIPFAVNYVY
jgi:hypothetical protein